MPLGEFAFIDQLLKPLARGTAAALGLVDDAAVLDPPAGSQLVLTKDAMVAGVHFLAEDPPGLIGQKLLRVNLSDLAAMGAEPLGYLLAIIRSGDLEEDWFRAFCDGLAEDQREFGLGLLGGDTTSTPGPLTLSLTAVGRVPAGQALQRSGARPGDEVWVSGTLGDGALGLQALQQQTDPGLAATAYLVDRYRRPQPRLPLGRRLRGLATAALDISDGLMADLGHIADASQVAAVVEAARLPLSSAAAGVDGALEAALTGGDDYELLFTAPPGCARRLEGLAADLRLPITRIGRIEPGTGVRALDAAGAPLQLARPGWTHF